MILQAMNERNSHSRGEIGIFAVRTRVNDRIIRIVVYIEHRRVRDVNSQRTAFLRRETSFLVSECCVTRCPDRHLRREDDRPAEVDRVGNEVPATGAKAGAGLEVRAEQQRNLAHRLKRVELRSDFDRRANGNREAADLLLLNVLGQSAPLR